MPYKIIEHQDGFSVVNTDDGKIFSKSTTYPKAVSQLRLLYRIKNLKDEDIEGEGLLDVLKKTFSKRKSGVLPPSFRKMIALNGNEEIRKMVVIRTPLEKPARFLLNTISLGTFDKAVKDSPFDNMFHLAVYINDKYLIDKQEVLKIVKIMNPIKKDSESMNVPIQKAITLEQLIANTKSFMGDSKFTNYDGKTNNCQDFIMAMLQANGLSNDALKKFIKQDAYTIFSKMPRFAEKLARIVTDIGAVANKLIEGEGHKKKSRKIPKSVVMKGKIVSPESVSVSPCWEGYEQIGMKKKKGRLVPNCVPITEKNNNSPMNKMESTKKEGGKVSWKDFVKRHMAGKKFKSREDANKYFKELSIKFKS